MGIFSNSSENKKDNIKKEDKNEDLLENTIFPSRVISTQYPIDDPNPIILAEGIYYNKIKYLGNKRNRTNENLQESKELKICNEDNNIENRKRNEIKKNSKEKELLEEQSEQKIISKKETENSIENEKLLEVETNDNENSLKEIKNENEKNLNELKDNLNDKINDNSNKNIKNENNKKYKEMKKYYKLLKKINILEEKMKNNFNSKKLEIDENTIYSYKCLTNNLYIKGEKGIDNLSLQINIKNDGKEDWPQENVFLLCNKEKSDIIAEDIQLIPLKSQMTYSVNIIFSYLNLVFAGKYNSYMNFSVNGKNFGRELKIIVEIIKN